jgi:hypothetical protein
MQKILTTIRNKPPHIKERVAVLSAIMLTSAVAFFWVSSLSTKFTAPGTKEISDKNISPFTVLKENLSAAVARTSSTLKAIGGNTPKTESTETANEPSVTIDENGVVVIGADK